MEKIITFAELTKQVHLIKDLILTDMICGTGDKKRDEEVIFSKHLLTMKNWYASISSSNKKRYVLALLEDVRSAWTLSCLLKSIWNCRTKDAIQSSYEKNPWSSYDQIPMDHNRTALPVVTLAQVMKNGRFWFLTLEPQAQAIVLTELLSLSGGPVMRAVLQRAQILYEKYREDQLQNLQECIVVNDTPHEKETHVIPEKGKKEQAVKFTHETTINGKASLPAGRAEKQLEANLAIWNNAIKAMRDSLKLEELEMTFKDGTKRNIWKVNRPNPESIETVTYIQLLPSEVAKIILSYLPQNQLSEYTRVNKYWAYLIDEYRIELVTQQRLQADYEKLQEQLLRHDLSIDVIDPASRSRNNTYCGVTSITPSSKMRVTLNMSLKASEKSAGAFSFRHLVGPERLTMPVLVMKPIRNLAELSERLERRGAADENIWQWCENILHNHKYRKAKRTAEGVLPSDNKHFPCRIIKETLHVPLNPPLYKDPAVNTEEKLKRNISNATVITMPKKPDAKKRLSLWSRDLSSLYKVYKIPSHASPI